MPASPPCDQNVQLDLRTISGNRNKSTTRKRTGPAANIKMAAMLLGILLSVPLFLDNVQEKHEVKYEKHQVTKQLAVPLESEAGIVQEKHEVKYEKHQVSKQLAVPLESEAGIQYEEIKILNYFGQRLRPKVPCEVGCGFYEGAMKNRKDADVVVLQSETKILTKKLVDSLLSDGLQLVLLTPTEAPPCRTLDPELCAKFHYVVALTSGSNVTHTLSAAPTIVPPLQSGWYNEPTFCQGPKDCIRGIMASVSSPTQLDWVTTNRDNISEGKFIRGYWTWELAKNFTVENFSAKPWVEAKLKNQTHIDHSRCFPSEQAFCDKLVRDGFDGTVSRSGAGKGMQWIAKILMGAMYKFTLEIENKQVPGYMTEKFYMGFLSRTLMVYRGPKDAKQFAPGIKSYIDIHDFESPEELSDYLHYLDNNHTAYLEYFDWKTKPLRQEFLDLFEISGLEEYDGIHDILSQALDAKVWRSSLSKSLLRDPGWPDNTSERSEVFVGKWASPQWRSNYDEFAKRRFESGHTWMCDICKAVTSDRKHHVSIRKS